MDLVVIHPFPSAQIHPGPLIEFAFPCNGGVVPGFTYTLKLYTIPPYNPRVSTCITTKPQQQSTSEQ